jgi:hypothetical protein
MSFFKKLGRGLKKAFRKGGAVSKFFKKGLPSGLEKVGGVANKIGRVAGKVLQYATPIIGAVAPELLPALAGANALAGAARQGGGLAKQAAGDYRSVVGGKKGVGSVNFGAYKNVGSQIGRDVKGGVDKIRSAVIERPKPQDSSDNSPQFV